MKVTNPISRQSRNKSVLLKLFGKNEAKNLAVIFLDIFRNLDQLFTVWCIQSKVKHSKKSFSRKQLTAPF